MFQRWGEKVRKWANKMDWQHTTIKATTKGLKTETNESFFNILHILKSIEYLNEGAGYPWARHESSNGLFSALVIDMLLTSFENAGALNPIGSERFRKFD